jgi:hypothetical protein
MTKEERDEMLFELRDELGLLAIQAINGEPPLTREEWLSECESAYNLHYVAEKPRES